MFFVSLYLGRHQYSTKRMRSHLHESFVLYESGSGRALTVAERLILVFSTALVPRPYPHRVTTFRTHKQATLHALEQRPLSQRDLNLESDIFDTLRQLLEWNAPPVWKRNRCNYNAHLVAAAAVLLKKAAIPDGPIGFWPVAVAVRPCDTPMSPDDVSIGGEGVPAKGVLGDSEVSRMPALSGEAKIKVFRREGGIRNGPGKGGDELSQGKPVLGRWWFSNSVCR